MEDKVKDLIVIYNERSKELLCNAKLTGERETDIAYETGRLHELNKVIRELADLL